MVVDLLKKGDSKQQIAAEIGISERQVAAIAAHLTMGTYGGGASFSTAVRSETHPGERVQLEEKHAVLHGLSASPNESRGILIGTDLDTKETVYWDPFPDSGSPNPHVLIFGESGYGKTYAIQCLVAELAQRKIPSIIFDYGQGFTPDSSPREFVQLAAPTTIDASKNGVAINPLQSFPFDLHGPLNVAQRVADTFARVYPKIGIQQHAILRQSVLDVLQAAGIDQSVASTWTNDPPSFQRIRDQLASYSRDPTHPNRQLAAKTESHVSGIFVFNTFRPSGVVIDWQQILSASNRAVILKLKGLESSLQRIVTEFLLWNMLAFLEAKGPGPLRCFAVIDEAHRVSFDDDAPTEQLLREGRKFGVGLILASQQAEDFSPVAISNTATKMVFQIADPQNRIARALATKAMNLETYKIARILPVLKRGTCLFLSANRAQTVEVASFETRKRM